MTQISLDHQFFEPVGGPPRSTRLKRLKFAYPRHYAWVLALAVLDIVVTTLVLSTGGKELNAIARWAIEHAGVLGMVCIKAASLALVLGICQYLGRHRPRAGLRIAEFALVANSVAVSCGLMYLTQFTIVLIQCS